MHYTASAVRYPLYDIQCTVSTIRYLMYSIRNKTFPVRHSVCNMQCEVTPLFRVGSLCVFTSWFCRFCWNVILQHLHDLFCSFLLKRHIAASSRPGFVVSVETSYCSIFTSWFFSFLLKRHTATSSRPGFVVSVETSYCSISTSWFCRFCWNVILHTFTSWFCRLCSFLKAPFAFSKYLHGKYSAKCCFGDGQVECSSAFKGFVSLSASLKKYFFRGLFQAMCFIQTIHERNPLHSGWV